MPDTLGVIGGGQLGRYFVVAAKARGYRTVVLEPDPTAPAGLVADEHLVSPYDDETALARMAEVCAAVTVEFENPPVSALDFLARHVVVRPSPEAVAVTQDRRREKDLCRDLGIATAPWGEVETTRDVESLVRSGLDEADIVTSGRYILKTARLGYDGKGQVRITDLNELARAWQEVNRLPCVVEAVVPLDMELSVVLARGSDGETAVYTPTFNIHVDGILDVSVAPLGATTSGQSFVTATIRDEAEATAMTLAEQLDYVGVLAVEFFVSNGRLLVNELAPRPHNSGHWTLDAAHTSQFEQQVLALTGLALGDPSMTHPTVAMGNLLGDRWRHGEPRFALIDQHPRARLHLYGKHDARPGRKMGHLTVVGSTPSDDVVRAVRQLRDEMTISVGSGEPR